MSQATVAAQIPKAPAPRVSSPRQVETLPTALLAECTCPGWCERDHDRD